MKLAETYLGKPKGPDERPDKSLNEIRREEIVSAALHEFPPPVRARLDGFLLDSFLFEFFLKRFGEDSSRNGVPEAARIR